jgi:hypothetical protein
VPHLEKCVSATSGNGFLNYDILFTYGQLGNGLLKFGRAVQFSSFLILQTGFAPAIKSVIIESETRNRRTCRRMLKAKDTLRATVHLSFDGRVFKTYHGPNAKARFANEVRVLRHLEARGCGFVPRLLAAEPAKLQIVTTNCGSRVEHLDAKRAQELFVELERFGVRHDDPDIRNVTYRPSDGRFCLIDFEFSTILPASKPTPHESK